MTVQIALCVEERGALDLCLNPGADSMQNVIFL